MNTKRRRAQRALDNSDVLGRLAPFDPQVVSTIFVGLDLDASDIDIVCCFTSVSAFSTLFTDGFSQFDGYRLIDRGDYLLGSFRHDGFEFEIYATPQPTRDQLGYRHYQIMRRLCAVGGEPFRTRVRALKAIGLKTEPALCRVLDLTGDPYQAILAVETWADDRIAARLTAKEPPP